MPGELEELAVVIGADITKFEAGIAGVAKGLAGLAGGAIAATATALIGLTKHAFTTVDELAKLSDRLNISTQKLAGLELGAELTGISVDQLALAMRKMNTVIEHASDGNVKAKETLEKLGLTAEMLKGQTPDKQLGMVADGLLRIVDTGKRAQVEIDLFGRGGSRMTTMLQDGSKGLEKFQKDAEGLGLAISRVDAAKIEIANEAWIRVEGALTGIGEQLAVWVSPFVKLIGDQLAEWISNGGVKGLEDGLVKVVGFLSDCWQKAQLFTQVFYIGLLKIAQGFESMLAIQMPMFAIAIEHCARQATLLQTTLAFLWASVAVGVDGAVLGFEKLTDAIGGPKFTSKLKLLGGAMTLMGNDAGGSAMRAMADAIDASGVDVTKALQKNFDESKSAATIAAGEMADAFKAINAPYELPKVNVYDDAAKKLRLKAEEESNKLLEKMNEEHNSVLFKQNIGFITDNANAEAKVRADKIEADRAAAAAAAAEAAAKRTYLGDYWNAEVKQANDEKNAAKSDMHWKISQTQSTLGTLSTLMNSHSKKAFEVGKIAAIANAVINTAEGATKALAQGGFFGFAMAAAVIAAGTVQIQNIKSTQFGGGGGGGGAPAAGGASTASAAEASGGGGGAAPSAPGRFVTINLGDDGFLSKGAVRKLINSINDELGDGATLRGLHA